MRASFPTRPPARRGVRWAQPWIENHHRRCCEDSRIQPLWGWAWGGGVITPAVMTMGLIGRGFPGLTLLNSLTQTAHVASADATKLPVPHKSTSLWVCVAAVTAKPPRLMPPTTAAERTRGFFRLSCEKMVLAAEEAMAPPSELPSVTFCSFWCCNKADSTQ